MRKYIKDCGICQKMKNKTEVLVGKLKLSKIPEKPWTYLTVNFITKLPIIAGKDAILVVYDRLSKMVHFVTTTKRMLVEGLAQLFRDNVWKSCGLLVSVLSDQKPQFTVEIIRKLNKMLSIEIKLLTSFNSQTDGQTEKMNQEFKQYSMFFINYRQKNWHEQFSSVSVYSKLWQRIENGSRYQKKRKSGEGNKVCKRMREVQEEVEAALKKAQEKIKQQADKGRREVEE